MRGTRERIFVFARTGIGDIVYTIPALRALRRRFPDAHITIEAGERGHSLLRYCPYVDEVWVRIRPRGLRGKLRSIWNLYRGRFDRAVILDRSDEKTLHTFLARIPQRYGVRKRLEFGENTLHVGSRYHPALLLTGTGQGSYCLLTSLRAESYGGTVAGIPLR